jgi:hypothetical protein
MQQDNNIQNKLQRLENQQLPDLSHLDEHWQQMQAMLQTPGSTGGKVISMNRWLWMMAGIVFIAAAFFITTHFVNKSNNRRFTTETIQTKKIEDNKNAATIISKNPSIDSTSINELIAKKTSSVTKKNPVIKALKKDAALNNIILPIKVDSATSTVKTITPDKQSILNNLLKDLEKKAQEFTIDNSKDTVLTGAEGSSLLIPANTLGGSNEVKITLKEFYKQSDIILNKLSTTSNGNQLVTGGMVQVTATVKGQPVSIRPNKAIRLYLPDTSSERMQQMQLFMRQTISSPANKENSADSHEERNSSQRDTLGFSLTNNMAQINWIPKNQYFNRLRTVTQVRVFNIVNEPFKVIKTSKGDIAYFVISDYSKLSRAQLGSILKQKYGYDKIHIKHTWADNIFHSEKRESTYLRDSGWYDGNIGIAIGDTIWINKSLAEHYNLQPIATRTFQENMLQSYTNSEIDNLLDFKQKINKKPGSVTKQDVFEKLKDKYYIDINSLGWINCDHFLNRTKLVEYAVNLNDSAANYYTMLVFTNVKSMMSGYLSGNKVTFENVPEGEPVKIVSIGIDKNGQPIMAIKETIIHKEEETGLQFEQVAAGNIKSSLSKMDTAP